MLIIISTRKHSVVKNYDEIAYFLYLNCFHTIEYRLLEILIAMSTNIKKTSR